jgi:hypothetical protein
VRPMESTIAERSAEEPRELFGQEGDGMEIGREVSWEPRNDSGGGSGQRAEGTKKVDRKTR